MADHKAEAIDFLRIAGEEGDWVPQSVGMAQVHATLALAEQQRIANLIAIYNGKNTIGLRSTLPTEVADQIRKGLNL